MEARQALEELIARSGQSMRALSIALGRSGNFIYELKRQEISPKAHTLARIAGACGYRLALIPKSEELPPDAIEIDART